MLESLFLVFLSLISMNGLVLGDYLCRNVNCHSSEPESELRSVSFDEERSAMIKSRMCWKESDNEPRLCRFQSNVADDSRWDVFKGRNCFCDVNCHNYHDCCLDYVFPKDAENSKDFSCRKLPNSSNYIYTVQRCPAKWEEEFVRSLCEEEAVSLQKDGKFFSHLQDVPVHSMWTNLFYRNVYCAACNGDVALTKWKTNVHCSGHTSHDNNTDDVKFHFGNATYNPTKKNWRIETGNTVRTCRLVIQVFRNWDKLSRVYQARRCKPAIDTCPHGADQYERQLCREYTSYVYEMKPGNGKLKAIYKNFHCARCNGVAAENVTCRDRTDILMDTDPKTPYLPILFDFNFFGDEDNQVGSSHSSCSMSVGQVWDPILGACMNITCGKSFKREGKECVRLNSESVDTDCLRIVLTSDMFVVTENSTVYVNYSRRYYEKGQYEEYKEENGTLLEISICAEEGQIHFLPGLEWLSEITLSISTVCLVLHLIVYAILPNLRNRPGKILMSLSSSLLCGHLFLLIGQYLKKMYIVCHIFGIITHYGYLAAFCWMSVMAFDIHSTFTASTTRTSSDVATFIKYSVFGWLISLLIVAVATIVDHTASQSTFRPKYGAVVCWINQKKALLVFFGIPVAALLLANLILFIITAMSIRKVSKQTRMVNKFSDKVRYYLYIKLAVVLGLTWLFGFLAAIFRIAVLWYPFVILNGLQGALIFFVFTFKKKVVHMLVVKLKIRSSKYKMTKDSKGKKVLYSSLSNLTTLQTTLTSSVAPVLSGSPEMLTAVRRIESKSTSTKL